MGGKTSTSTQSTSIPREVLERYNAVNVRAEQAAQQPFMQYPGQFVAGLTPTQQQGIQRTSEAAGMSSPYYGAAAQYTLAGGQDVGALTPGQIAYYQNPYTQAVAAPTYEALRQQQAQEMQGQTANAIKSGAFGGDRAGIVAANLARQQLLGTAQAMAPIYQQGYQQAIQTATQQQGVLAQDLARRMQTGAQLAQLGTGAQQAALAGAQAQLAAGTAEQQTRQADLTAQYQQFLQERGYPFQVAQFLANIAMGTGALSGSTTTTTQPAGFFSDRRLKHDVERIGETDSGLPIYKYRYNGDDRAQIGLMAQDVEKKKPEAVGLAAAADGHYYKTVDYDKATGKAEGGSATATPLSTKSYSLPDSSVNMSFSAPEDAPAPPVTSGLTGYIAATPRTVDYSVPDTRRSSVGFNKGMMSDPSYWRNIDYDSYPNLAYGKGFTPRTYGGAVTQPGNYARGGYIGGGLVAGDDLRALLESQKQFLNPYGQGRVAGGAPGLGGIVPEAKLPVPKLITHSGMPAQRPSGFQEAASVGKNVADIYETGKKLKTGFTDLKKYLTEDEKKTEARGGRIGYEDGGEIDPYDISNDPLGDVVRAGKQQIRQLPKPGQLPSAPKSGFSELADLAKGASSLYSLGSTLAAFLPFSDERMKDNVRPVGETYEGQTIYSYNIGDKPTELGLMAQESRRDAVHKDGLGLLHLDYDKATEGSRPFAYGGLVPRQGYADGGMSDEADLPALGAIETASPDEVERIAGAIRKIESSNRANALGAVSPKTGDRAYGLYQIMGANIPSWSEAALGRRVSVGEFLENPDIQHQIAKHRIGQYLDKHGNPTDVASMWFSGRPAERAMGLKDYTGTSTPAYLARFQKAYAGDFPAEGAQEAEARTSLGEAAKRAGEYGGVPSKSATLGDVVREYAPSGMPTSEKFWVPALGFLGSMLGSKSPTLGQAIGEGLMGGVGAYTALEKARPDIEKVQAETRGLEQRTDLELVDRLLKFNQVRAARGQLPIRSLDEFKKKLADGSIIEESGQVKGEPRIAAPTTTVQPGQTPQTEQPPVEAPRATPRFDQSTDAAERALNSPPVQAAMNKIDWSNIADSHNIPAIQEELRRTKILADTAVSPEDLQKYQERQAQLRGEINKILESKQLVTKDGSVFTPPEWQRAANQLESQKVQAQKDAERFSSVQDSMQKMQDAVPDLMMRYVKMGDILQRFQSDPLQNFKTGASAIAAAAGIPVDESKINSRADFEKFVKAARDQLFARLQEQGGRMLVSELQRMQESVPDPTLQPESNRSLIAQGKGITEYHQAFADAFRQEKRRNPYMTADDFAEFQRDWQKKNKLKDFIDKNEAETPVRGHLPNLADRKDGWLYVVDDPNARKIYPKGFIGRWNKELGTYTDLRPAP